MTFSLSFLAVQVWYGMAWFCMVVGHGLTWNEWYGMVWYGMVWHGGRAWFGMEWYGMELFGMPWVCYGMVCYGVHCSSGDAVQVPDGVPRGPVDGQPHVPEEQGEQAGLCHH